MKKILSKPYRWAGIFSVLFTAAVTFTLMETFVLTKSMAKVTTTSSVVSQSTTSKSAQAATQSNSTVTDNSYQDENIKITIDTVRKDNTTMYVADIQVSDVSYLKTALANDTYGRNIKATTSEMAAGKNAIFAINGDYYGFRDTGYVLRNGTAYRTTAGENEGLVIDKEGNLSVVSEDTVSLQSLSDKGA
ncbi:hypothetical protein CSC2_13480 [Clostridium zeae]|uniref:Phosphodiester glycosidase domain-containing protein n=1 Tax=Clostridium zeae TaxID=2759022 RepID=A0ABQ1E7R0_9CLOT|nr:hypothetical protein [Clostridium zeae]GFZ30822.1 hypothetical protein CSC2_13480 [Clostridium zeae]